VLIAQRPPGKHLALKWEFPGGKLEPGESPEAAIRREIREELGCEILPHRVLPSFLHDYGAVRIRMIPVLADLAPGSPEPSPVEHLAIEWVYPAELASRDLAAADLPIVAGLL